LRGANLRGVDLSEAVLDATILDRAEYNETTQWPAGYDPSLSKALFVGMERAVAIQVFEWW
jgi:uncharacterized protein YjbI with pentapeptide repeats